MSMLNKMFVKVRTKVNARNPVCAKHGYPKNEGLSTCSACKIVEMNRLSVELLNNGLIDQKRYDIWYAQWVGTINSDPIPKNP